MPRIGVSFSDVFGMTLWDAVSLIEDKTQLKSPSAQDDKVQLDLPMTTSDSVQSEAPSSDGFASPSTLVPGSVLGSDEAKLFTLTTSPEGSALLQSWLDLQAIPSDDEHGSLSILMPKAAPEGSPLLQFWLEQLGVLSSDDERASPSTLVPGSVLRSDQAKPDTPMMAPDGDLPPRVQAPPSDDGNTSVVDKAEHGSVSGSDDEPNLDPLATTPEGGSLPQVQREEHSSDDKQVAPSTSSAPSSEQEPADITSRE